MKLPTISPSVLLLVLLFVAALLFCFFVSTLRENTCNSTYNTKQKHPMFQHSANPSEVPGKGLTFEEQDTMLSTSGKILRTYWTKPKYRRIDQRLQKDKTQMYKASKKFKPKGVVLFNCTFGWHMNRVAHFAQELAKMGYVTTGFDYKGCGESQGKRGYMDNFEDIVTDIISYGRLLKTKYYPEVPLFIGGHGFGATISIAAVLKQSDLWEGMLLLSPDLLPTVSPLARKLLPLLATCFPSFRLIHAEDQVIGSRNLAVGEYNKNDTFLFRDDIPIKTANEMLRLKEYVLENLGKLKTHFHLRHGVLDYVAAPTSTKIIMEKVNKKLYDPNEVFMDRIWHDLLHSSESYEVIEDCIDWIDERLRIKHLKETLD